MTEDELAWAETQQRRQREQLVVQRAAAERLQQKLIAAQETGKTVEQQRIEAEMQALANQTSQRLRNAQKREEKAARLASRWTENPLVQGALEVQGYNPAYMPNMPTKVNPLGEGVPPLPAFEASLRLSEATERRRDRLEAQWPRDAGDVTAEQARVVLGKALQQAVDSGLISEPQGLLAMVATGLNADPIPQGAMRTLLFDLLAQAVKSRLLQVGRARSIARLIQDAPVNVNEAPGEVPVPAAEEPMDLEKLRALALAAAPLSGSILTPSGLEQVGAELQMVASEVPELVDRLQRLEDLVYDALLVHPCHEGHELHLQTPVLCDQQMGAMVLELLVELGVNMRALPRDVHRDEQGEKATCCQQDGRIGTWLVYGQFIGPTVPPDGVQMRGES